MNNEEGQDFFRGVLEIMASYLLALGVGDDADTTMEAYFNGETVRLRVRDRTGKLALSVIGKNAEEVGEQLALACLHNLSLERLGALHMEPLKGSLHVHKRKD